MQAEDEALDTFRKVVSFLYREIGAMLPENHPHIYSRSTLGKSEFAKNRKQQAKSLYHLTTSTLDPDEILAPYTSATGLSLEDLEQAFSEGDWLSPSGNYSFGGPNWARIAAVANRLRNGIRHHDESSLKRLVAEVRILCHNTGRLVDKFAQLDPGPNDDSSAA